MTFRMLLLVALLSGSVLLAGCIVTEPPQDRPVSQTEPTAKPTPPPDPTSTTDETKPTMDKAKPTTERTPSPDAPDAPDATKTPRPADIPAAATAVKARQEESPTGEREIFLTYCASCHGERGGGTNVGVALNTADVQNKEHEVLARTVRDGVAGTAMPGWGPVLEPGQIEQIVTYIQRDLASEGAASAPAFPTATPIDMDDTEAVMQLGEQLYRTNCASCHGEDGIGSIGPAINSQQFLTRHNDALIRDAIISGGWRPDSRMPAFGEHMKKQEIESLVRYIRSWEPTAPLVDDPRGSDQIARGVGQGMIGGGAGQGQGSGQGQSQGRGQGQSQGRGQGQSQGRGQGQSQGPGQGQSQGPGQGQSQGSGQGQSQGSGQGQSQGSGQGQGQGPGQGQGQGGMMMVRNATPVSYSGEVVQVEGSLLTFRTNRTSNNAEDGGQEIEAMLGPLWYWYDNKIPLEPGDPIQVEGFQIPDYYLVVSSVVNERSGQTYQARTPEGVPLWSRGGQQTP
jgi:mono/diheme cytochrome c family protein